MHERCPKYFPTKKNLIRKIILQTSKNLRPKLEKLELSFNYNFDQQTIDFNDIKIANELGYKIKLLGITEIINNKLGKTTLYKSKKRLEIRLSSNILQCKNTMKII